MTRCDKLVFLRSLASPATHGLGGVRVHPSSSSMLSATPDNAAGYIPVDDLPNGVGIRTEEWEEGLPTGQQDEEKQQPRSRSGRR